MLRLSVALLLLTGVESAGFSYDRCDAATGPGNWSGVCKTNTQGTPIDLCNAVAFTPPALNLTGYTAPLTMNILNNGHTIQCGTTSTPPEFQAGTLSTMVGRGTNTVPQTWAFAQIHFHWGRTGFTNEGSEHFIQGVRYPIEGHLVHYNKKYGNISAAVASGSNDALAVVGVMFELSSSDVPFMVAAADAVSTATATPRTYTTSAMLSDLWNGMGDFYSYGGGLTTPGCVEIVTWIVMKTPKPITLATLNKFKAASEDPSSPSADLIAKYGNYRPILPHNGRVIYSSNGATAACTNLSEPVFTCNNVGVGQGSSQEVVQAYITDKYGLQTFTVNAVAGLSTAALGRLAQTITQTETITSAAAVYSFVVASANQAISVVADATFAVSSFTVLSWGDSTSKAVTIARAPTPDGFAALGLPYDFSRIYAMLVAIDRLSASGTLQNNAPMTFTVRVQGVSAGLVVRTHSSSSPSGTDVVSEGGAVQYIGGFVWRITVPRTSAVSLAVQSVPTAAPQNPTNPPAPTTPAPTADLAPTKPEFLGLLALLVLLPAVAFLGLKTGSKKAAPAAVPLAPVGAPAPEVYQPLAYPTLAYQPLTYPTAP